MNKWVKHILWTLSMAFLLLLWVQTEWQPFSLDRWTLKNDPKDAPKPVLTMQSYKSGDFQGQAERHLRENFAFRELGIRTYNQFRYSLWKVSCNEFFFPGRTSATKIRFAATAMMILQIYTKLWESHPVIKERRK